MIVLIVEDDAGLVSLWRKFLEPVAREIRVAFDLVEALRLMRFIPPPDVVLLDLGLPGSKAENTLAHILELKEANPQAAVIVITGNVEQQMEALAMKLGADHFARKQDNATSQSALLEVVRVGLSVVSRKGPVYERPLQLLERLTALTSETPHIA